MDDITTLILKIIISVAIALIAKYAIPYLKALTENEKYRALVDAVETAVQAAEQTIKESGQGKAKKAQVVAYITAWLNERKLHVTEAEIDNLIEAAVLALK